MTRWMRLLLAAAAVFGIVYLRFPPQGVVSPTVAQSDNISPLSTFIYKVYLDRRAGLNRLRVLAVNRCHRANESILSVRLNGSFVPLVPRPLEGQCPWKWASGCWLATYFHDVDFPPGVAPDEVILKGDIQSGVKSVHKVYNSVQQGFTICVPPMYWYTDWTKLILFLEWWKTQNVSKFIFYHQSYTKEIHTVLEHYVKEGIVEIVPWPLLPASEKYNPNDKVYRIAHSLAQNDCSLRATTEYVAIVDVDELILPRNGTLLTNLKGEFVNATLGSLLFAHRILLFYPPLASVPFNFSAVTYEGIKRASTKNILGPPKAIVRRDAVDRISTHTVISFLNDRWGQNLSTKAILLHSRYNYVGVWTNHTETPIRIINEAEPFQKRLIAARNKIFPKGAKFNEESQRELGRCLGSWRKTQNNCKAPATACSKEMKDREVWLEATNMPYIVV